MGAVATVQAVPSNWIDWTSPFAGSLMVDGHAVSVNLEVQSNDPTGSEVVYDQDDGTFYFRNPVTIAGGTYGDFAPSDLTSSR